MNIVSRFAVKLLALFLFAPFIAASCATVVTFDVERPPLVDLRGINTITVIPFEWNSVREQTYLAKCVTTALLAGLRWGNVNIVDPYTLENNGGWNYRQFADVYITGRITNVNVYDQVDIINQTYINQNMIRETVIGTAIVDIEYSYIRSSDNRTLGYYRKSETTTSSFERTRYQEQDSNRYNNRNINRNTARDTARRGAGWTDSSYPRRGSWQESIAESAILQFSDTMVHELGPWTVTESRHIKKRTGDDQLAARANNYIEQDRYDDALSLYKTIYEQSGNIFAGYNAAILLAANQQFADALGLLERLRDRQLQEGKSIPPFIKNEIKKMAVFIDGNTKLKTINGGETKMVYPAPTPAPAPESELLAGSVNLPWGSVYALNGPVLSIDDNSIFPKMVAYADVLKGQWLMRIPDGAPAEVWLLVTDGHHDFFITKTAVRFFDTIALDITMMTKLN